MRGIRTCMKVGLLPANMHRRVRTKAARPKMTGINAVGRSILDKRVAKVLGKGNQCGTESTRSLG
jgi:hypothetical protein